jgi:hypothetical protein
MAQRWARPSPKRLETAGDEFIAENGGGAAVRLRKESEKRSLGVRAQKINAGDTG